MSKTQNRTEAEACFDHHWVGLLPVLLWGCGMIYAGAFLTCKTSDGCVQTIQKSAPRVEQATWGLMQPATQVAVFRNLYEHAFSSVRNVLG